MPLLASLLCLSALAVENLDRAIDATPAPERPTIDGQLTEGIWRVASVASDFRQVEPRDGDAAGQRTEVVVAYDRDALYIAARLHDSDPRAIVARLGRRDAQTDSDLFRVAIDSYHDHRTAFRFSVNPVGVKGDDVTANDDQQYDDSWDPVWDVATRTDAEGWTVEMRIPLSQLRFSGAAVQEWGINFERLIQRTGELDRWRWAPNSETGYASLFGHLRGLRDIASARSHRLEVLPYALAQGDFDTSVDRADPFTSRTQGSAAVGADVKFGLSSALTLTGTVNPDFGQVEADPAEVNLTVYETYFLERRPFFVEGANLFSFGAGSSGQIFGAPQLFYSRRVGRPPAGGVPFDALFADVPEVTRILGAAKVSGQARGWSVGVLDAVTPRERANVLMPDDARREIDVEPATNYGVLSVRREFRGGRSGLGFFGTTVNRRIDESRLAFLRTSAYAAGIDVFHGFAGNQYSVSGTVAGSTIRGSPLSIELAQRSSARYYQRPDQDYVALDPSRTALSGYAMSLSGGKTAGRWRIITDFFATSPGFEINDAGFQQSADRVFHGVRTSHRWLQPTSVFRSSSVYFNASQQWNYGGIRVSRNLFTGFAGQLHNRWSLSLDANLSRPSLSDRVTRGGPLILIPQQWSVSASVTSDPRRAATANVYGTVTRNESGGYLNSATLELGYRPSAALELTLAPTLNETHSAAGYVTAAADPTAVTMYGRRYIVADLTQRTMDVTLRADLSVTSTLSIRGYAQPFTSSVDYDRFKAFTRPRVLEFMVYARDGASTLDYDDETRVYQADADGAGPAPSLAFGDPDFSLRSLRANVVLRWDYRAGSTLYVAWAHGRSTVVEDPTFLPMRSLGDLFADDQRNRLLLKVSYWFNP